MKNELKAHVCQNVPWAKEVADEQFKGLSAEEIDRFRVVGMSSGVWEHALPEGYRNALFACPQGNCLTSYHIRMHRRLNGRGVPEDS